MGGLFVAIFLTLLYLPGLYALWFRKSLEEGGRVKRQPRQCSMRGMHARQFRLLKRLNN